MLSVHTLRSCFRKNQSSFIVAFVVFLLIAGCKKGPQPTGEIQYVTVPLASLRDRVAAVYNKTGSVNNGEKVEVIERSKAQ